MAVIPAVITNGTGGLITITWSGMVNSDTGAPINLSDYADRTVTITGTFDGIVTLDGSNDGATYMTQLDAGGTAISKVAAFIGVVGTNPAWTRPAVAAGSSASIKVIIHARRG